MNITDFVKPGMKGAFYGRHSTDKQEMDSQKTACEEFVKKHELSLIDSYLDSAVSARKKVMYERPELKRLLEDAKKSKFDFVLVWSEDRLARKTREHREIRKKFIEYEIPVYVIHNNTRYDEGELLSQTIRDSFSQYQGDKIAGDTKRAMRTLNREGRWTTELISRKSSLGIMCILASNSDVRVPTFSRDVFGGTARRIPRA